MTVKGLTLTPGQAEVYATAGLFCGLAAEWASEVILMPMADWKKAICRESGAQASKREIRETLQLRYPAWRTYDGLTADAYDALGVVCAYLDAQRIATGRPVK